MRILALSDLHFHNYKIEAVNDALVDVFTKQIPDIIDREKIDCITISGDIFHVRGSIKPSVFNQTFSYFKDLCQKVPVVMTFGNHDLETLNSSVSAVSIWVFHEIPNCYILNGDILEIKGCKIGGIGYRRTAQETIDGIKFVSDADVILMHYGIDDFKPANVPDCNLTLKDLPKDKWVLAGHYHNCRQSKKVIQVGSPIQHNFGDTEQARGCWIIDTDKNKATFIKLQYPEFKKITSRDIKKTDLNNCIVRLVLVDAKKATVYKQDVINKGAIYVDVIIEKEFKKDEARVIKINSIREMLEDYLEIAESYKSDKDKILAMFDKINAMEL